METTVKGRKHIGKKDTASECINMTELEIEREESMTEIRNSLF